MTRTTLARVAPAGAAASMTTDRNVLLIVLDDIGVEWFSFYGIGDRFCTDPQFQYCRTPVLDNLRANGLMFVEAYVNPVCGPSRAGFHTGQYGFRTGFGTNIRDATTTSTIGNRLADSLPWLPRAIELARPGVYDKGTVGKWHMCDGYSTVVPSFEPLPAPNANLDHAVAAGYDYSSIHIPNYGCAYRWHRIVDGIVQPAGGYTSPPYGTSNWLPSVNMSDAATWIAGRTNPWFMHLAFNPPHVPMAVPPFETLSQETINELTAASLVPGQDYDISATYATIKLVWRAAMESVDTCIGQLLAGLTPVTRANTMILVIGDNGTVNNAIPPGFPHTKRDIYRGGTHVPLLVQGPMVVQPGRVPIDLVSAVDIYATILDIASAKAPATVADSDGISFLPVIQNLPGKRTRMMTESFGPWGATEPSQWTGLQRALFDGRWRYVNRQGVLELYDNHADFLELDNIIAANPAVAQQLARELDELVGS